MKLGSGGNESRFGSVECAEEVLQHRFGEALQCGGCGGGSVARSVWRRLGSTERVEEACSHGGAAEDDVEFDDDGAAGHATSRLQLVARDSIVEFAQKGVVGANWGVGANGPPFHSTFARAELHIREKSRLRRG